MRPSNAKYLWPNDLTGTEWKDTGFHSEGKNQHKRGILLHIVQLPQIGACSGWGWRHTEPGDCLWQSLQTPWAMPTTLAIPKGAAPALGKHSSALRNKIKQLWDK